MQWSPLKAADTPKLPMMMIAKLMKMNEYWTFCPRCIVGSYESPRTARVSLSAALKLRVKKLMARD